MLLRFKVDHNQKNKSGYTPLHLAAGTSQFHVRVTQFNTINTGGETCIVNRAKVSNYVTIVHAILALDKLAADQVTNNDQNTPLHIAATAGHVDIMEVYMLEILTD
jgi:ankyrin repeat protein